jgi:hypothetical protein
VLRTARVMAWLLWRRNRWAFLALLAYGAVVALAIHFFVKNSPPMFTLETAPPLRATFFAAALPLFFGLLYLMAVFSFPEADLAVRQSGFPTHLLARPARTAALVFWPMLYGTVTIAAGWMAFARLVLHPNGMLLPVDWPAAMFAAGLACLQALTWSPVGLPYLRLILALLLLPALAALGIAGSVNGVSPSVVIAGYCGVIVLAAAAAVAGLWRARRGAAPEWHWWPRASSRSDARLPCPFTSPAQAQLWFEWRRNGMSLPLLMGGFCFLLTLPLAWVRDLVPLGAAGPWGVPALRELELNLWVKLQQGCLLWPVIFATIVGCGLRKSDTRRKDLSLHPFLATRPMTTSALVGAKLRMALFSTLAAWGVLLLFLWGWLLTPARENGRSGPLAVLILSHFTPRAALLALLVLAVLVLWTWRNQVLGLAVDLTGRPSIVHGVPTMVTVLFLFGLVKLSEWWSHSHEMSSEYFDLPWFVPWLGGAAVALKAAAALWALRELARRRLMEPRVLARLGAAWLLVALGLFGLLSWLAVEPILATLPLPTDLVPRLYLALAVLLFLFLPLTRLALAPLALQWNRHR